MIQELQRMYFVLGLQLHSQKERCSCNSHDCDSTLNPEPSSSSNQKVGSAATVIRIRSIVANLTLINSRFPKALGSMRSCSMPSTYPWTKFQDSLSLLLLDRALDHLSHFKGAHVDVWTMSRVCGGDPLRSVRETADSGYSFRGSWP